MLESKFEIFYNKCYVWNVLQEILLYPPLLMYTLLQLGSCVDFYC